MTGLDSSATHSFAQIKQAADDHRVRLVLVNLAVDLQRALRASQFQLKEIILASDLDRALESCEETIIEAHSSRIGQERSLRAWLSEDLGSAEYAEYLVEHCRRLDVQAGDVIARQGELADSMHFILEGRIGIFVDLADGRLVRVRSLGRHTTIGEMGLITGQPRSAMIRAEIASVIYELRADLYHQIGREQPALSQALLRYVIKIMAERLSFANRVIGVLQR